MVQRGMDLGIFWVKTGQDGTGLNDRMRQSETGTERRLDSELHLRLK